MSITSQQLQNLLNNNDPRGLSGAVANERIMNILQAMATILAAGGGGGGGGGDVDLETSVTGVLPVANGGSGTATPGLVAGSGVSVFGDWPNQEVGFAGGPILSLGLTFQGPALVGRHDGDIGPITRIQLGAGLFIESGPGPDDHFLAVEPLPALPTVSGFFGQVDAPLIVAQDLNFNFADLQIVIPLATFSLYFDGVTTDGPFSIQILLVDFNTPANVFQDYSIDYPALAGETSEARYLAWPTATMENSFGVDVDLGMTIQINGATITGGTISVELQGVLMPVA